VDEGTRSCSRPPAPAPEAPSLPHSPCCCLGWWWILDWSQAVMHSHVSTLPANTTADLALAPMNGPGRRHYYAWEGLCTACAHDNDYVNHVRHRWHREAATREAISLIEHISHQCYTASMTTTRNGPVRIEAASAARRYLLLSINSLLGQLAKHQDPRDYTVKADAAVSHHASPS
jgi:hypothetical protein